MQEKVAGSHFVCLARVSGTAASTGLHTARACCFHLKSRIPDFPWPCCLDALMPAHHGHPPLQSTHGVGNPVYFAFWSSRQEASPTNGLQCTSEILAGNSCIILLLPYQLHFSGNSNSLWPGSFSVPVIFFMV